MIRRVLLPIVVVAVAILLIARWSIAPTVCNRTRIRVAERTMLARQQPLHRVSAVLWDNLRDAQRCLDRVPGDIVLLTAQADCLAQLGRYEDAIEKLDEALRYDRRPELLIYRGIAQIAAGRREDGIQSLTRAAMFYGDGGYAAYMLRGIPERELVLQRLRAASR